MTVPSGAEPQDWEFQPSEEVWGYQPETSVWSSPAVAEVNGRAVLFVGSYDRNLYALDAATGEELWRYTTGGGIRATPAVARVGDRTVVFVGSDDRTFYALDAGTRRKLWAREVMPWRVTLGRASLTAPAVFERQGQPAVLFGYWVYDRSAAHPLERAGLRAYDAARGDLLWERELGQSEPSNPLVMDVDGWPQVVVGARDGTVTGLDARDGREVWRYSDRMDIVSSPAFVADSVPPLVLIGSRFGYLRALDARTGEPAWSFRTGHWVDSTPAVARVGRRTVAFFGSHDQAVYAVDVATGQPLWAFNTKGDVYSSPAVLSQDGRTLVAVTSGDDYLYVLDGETGREVWRTSPGHFLWGYRVVGDSVWSSPAGLRLNGATLLLVPFYDGQVHTYRLDWAEREGPRGRTTGYGRAMLWNVFLSVVGTLVAVLVVTGLGRQFVGWLTGWLVGRFRR